MEVRGVLQDTDDLATKQTCQPRGHPTKTGVTCPFEWRLHGLTFVFGLRVQGGGSPKSQLVTGPRCKETCIVEQGSWLGLAFGVHRVWGCLG